MRAIPYLAVLALLVTLDFFVLQGRGTVVAIHSIRQAGGAVVTTLAAPLR